MGLPNEIHPFLITGNDANQFKVANSLRFRASATAYLNRTPAVSSGNTLWTYSVWIKRGLLGSSGNAQYIIGGNSSTSGGTRFEQIFAFNTSDSFTGYGFSNSSGYAWQRVSNAKFRDPSAWYHVVIQFDSTNATAANRLIVYVNNEILTWATSDNSGAGGDWTTSSYLNVNNNVLNAINGGFQGGGVPIYFGDAYMAEANMVSGSKIDPTAFGQTDSITGIWSPKKYTGTYGTNGFYLPFSNTTSTTQNLLPYSEQFNQASYWGGSNISYTSNSVAAPNGVTAADTCAATATGTAYGNALTNITFSAGQTYTYSMYAKAGTASCFGLNIQPSYSDRISAQYNLSTGTFIGGIVPGGTTSTFVTGGMQFVGNEWYRCWLTATTAAGTGLVYFGPLNTITTPATDPFNNTIGNSVYVWGAQLQAGAVPGPYTLTTTSAVSTAELSIGADNSNGSSSWNNWRSSGISVTSGTTYDSMIDSPTNYADGGNGRGNYAVLNPVLPTGGTYSEANLRYVGPSAWRNARTSIALPPTGKWYFEATVVSSGQNNTLNSTYSFVGLVSLTTDVTSAGYNATGFVVLNDTGWLNNNATITNVIGAPLATNNLIGIAADVDANTFTFYRTNSSVATGTIGMSAGTPLIFVSGSYDATYGNFIVNFGQRPFSYTPPTGFKALNTYNLPNPSLPLV